jgi:predicted enzyme involved in methoxymalonyl-ACP biosynthesis
MVRRGVVEKEFDGDAAAFLAASNLQVETLEVKDEVKVRALELIQRTNQLNLTGRRYAIKEFDALLSSADCIGIRAYDKYGDYGIVGFIVGPLILGVTYVVLDSYRKEYILGDE